MHLSEKFSSFYNNPFEFVDNLHLVVKGKNLNIFQKYVRLRTTAFFVALTCLGAWIVFGFDSTPLQFIHLLYALPQYLTGQFNLNQWINVYHQFYGKEMHYSAFVFYGMLYYVLSKHFEKFNIKCSKNVCYATSLMLLSVAVFEWFWLFSFAFWQNQWWSVTWQMPQLTILLQNSVFLIAGVMGVLYLWADSYVLDGKEVVGRNYQFNLNWTAFLLIILSIGLAVFWWFYPFPIQCFKVTLTDGMIWMNNNHFPQTLYTIKLTPNSAVNAGEWFYVQDNLVHLVNTLVKFVWTFTIGYIGLIRKFKTNCEKVRERHHYDSLEVKK